MTSVWEATIVAVFLMYSVLLPFVGEKGDRGDIGQEGISGLQGDPGSEGARGAQGPPGPKGEKGNQGVDGVQGEKGTWLSVLTYINIHFLDTILHTFLMLLWGEFASRYKRNRLFADGRSGVRAWYHFPAGTG